MYHLFEINECMSYTSNIENAEYLAIHLYNPNSSVMNYLKVKRLKFKKHWGNDEYIFYLIFSCKV